MTLITIKIKINSNKLIVDQLIIITTIKIIKVTTKYITTNTKLNKDNKLT